MKALKYLLALALLALAITPSFGSNIPVYSTGQCGSSTCSTYNQVDSNYTIVSAPTGSGPAYTVDPYSGGGSLQRWLTPPPTGTWWINPYHAESNGQPFDDAPEGLYIYQTTFTLAPGWTNASLSGAWAVDNSGTMNLNGNLVSTIADPGFRALTDFSATIQSWFVTGTNTLTFDVHNDGSSCGCQNPTGLLVQISGTVSSTTPEPSSLLLMGSGVLGLAGVVRRKLVG
jgi:hypothetical protein